MLTAFFFCCKIHI